MSIIIRRPIIDMETRLRDIPPDWLRYIEPRIIRGSFLPCWIWGGSTDRNGYPLMTCPYNHKTVMAKRWVARLFWDYPESAFVSDTCGHRNCLNPYHILVSTEHPRWLKRDFK